MRRNAERDGYAGSEQALARLAPVLGARRAQALLQEVLGAGLAAGVTAARALAEAGVADGPDAADSAAVLDPGACGDMVDLVVGRARAARAAEPPDWP
jgi:adenylosuccinate lyase